jgi:hypothetical protein
MLPQRQLRYPFGTKKGERTLYRCFHRQHRCAEALDEGLWNVNDGFVEDSRGVFTIIEEENPSLSAGIINKAFARHKRQHGGNGNNVAFTHAKHTGEKLTDESEVCYNVNMEEPLGFFVRRLHFC